MVKYDIKDLLEKDSAEYVAKLEKRINELEELLEINNEEMKQQQLHHEKQFNDAITMYDSLKELYDDICKQSAENVKYLVANVQEANGYWNDHYGFGRWVSYKFANNLNEVALIKEQFALEMKNREPDDDEAEGTHKYCSLVIKITEQDKETFEKFKIVLTKPCPRW